MLNITNLQQDARLLPLTHYHEDYLIKICSCSKTCTCLYYWVSNNLQYSASYREYQRRCGNIDRFVSFCCSEYIVYLVTRNCCSCSLWWYLMSLSECLLWLFSLMLLWSCKMRSSQRAPSWMVNGRRGEAMRKMLHWNWQKCGFWTKAWWWSWYFLYFSAAAVAGRAGWPGWVPLQ